MLTEIQLRDIAETMSPLVLLGSEQKRGECGEPGPWGGDGWTRLRPVPDSFVVAVAVGSLRPQWEFTALHHRAA